MQEIPTIMMVVAAALHDLQGRWLLQRRPAGKAHGGLWEFPGGKVEQGENPRAALSRELAEELAIAIDPATLLPVGFAEGEGGRPSRPIVLLLYSAGFPGGVIVPDEGQDHAFFHVDDAADLPLAPMDRQLLEFLRERGLPSA